LDASCDVIDFAMRECFKRIDRSDEVVAHYCSIALPRSKGGLKVSEDTTTLLSPDLIDAFALPYLRKALERSGGGYVHYCGKNYHLLDVLLKEPLAWGINFGNPEMHDMTDVLARCKQHRKVYVGGIKRHDGEGYFDYFKRILEPAYDRDTGRFFVVPGCGCGMSEREMVIGEFERAVEAVRSLQYA